MSSARPPGSPSLRFQPRIDEVRGLSEHTRPESERALDDASLPTHISCEVEHGRLALTQYPHAEGRLSAAREFRDDRSPFSGAVMESVHKRSYGHKFGCSEAEPIVA